MPICRTLPLLLSLIAFSAHAAPLKVVPRLNCNPSQAYLNNLNYYLNKITPAKVPQIYYLHNVSNYTLIVDHPMPQVGASAGWYSYLTPNNWSAIAVSQTGFALRCHIAMADGKNYQANCNLLKVCQPNLTVTNGSGNYWLVENQPWDAFIPAVKAKGVTASSG